MKKIVFVEKEEGSYDPVVNFFNKKNTNPNKTSHPSTQNTNSTFKPPMNKKPASVMKPSTFQKTGMKILEDTPKVEAKEQGVRSYPSKEDVLKSRDQGKRSVKKETKGSFAVNNNFIKKTSEEDIRKLQKDIEEPREDSLEKKFKKEEEPQFKPKNEPVQNANKGGGDLVKRISELQKREQEYISKIEELEAKEQKYVKNQQKLSKMQKDYKAALQKSKQAQSVLSKLKDKDSQIKELMQGKSIPFSRKRQVILSNKIRELKRTNRQLVLRLKNYKGTDLVDLSIQQNREEIMKDLYTVDVEREMRQELDVEMESLLGQLSQQLQQYLDKKVKGKGKCMQWSQEQLFVVELMQLAEKISLGYLQRYDVCPLPKSNEEAMSAYSLLEQYKTSNQMQKAIDHYHLNFTLSKENAEMIERLHEVHGDMVTFRTEPSKTKKKQGNQKGKLASLIKMYERRCSMTESILIQNICHQQIVKQWMEKVHARVGQELTALTKTIGQIKDIVEVGESAKESLYFYLANNIPALQVKLPNLKMNLKEIKVNLSQLDKIGQDK